MKSPTQKSAKFINMADMQKGVKPPKAVASRLKEEMMGGPVGGNDIKGAKCPQCGHKHGAGKLCSYQASISVEGHRVSPNSVSKNIIDRLPLKAPLSPSPVDVAGRSRVSTTSRKPGQSDFEYGDTEAGPTVERAATRVQTNPGKLGKALDKIKEYRDEKEDKPSRSLGYQIASSPEVKDGEDEETHKSLGWMFDVSKGTGKPREPVAAAPTAAPAKPRAPTAAPTAAPAKPRAPTAAPAKPRAPTAAPTKPRAPTAAPTKPRAPTAAPTKPRAPTASPVMAGKKPASSMRQQRVAGARQKITVAKPQAPRAQAPQQQAEPLPPPPSGPFNTSRLPLQAPFDTDRLPLRAAKEAPRAQAPQQQAEPLPPPPTHLVPSRSQASSRPGAGLEDMLPLRDPPTNFNEQQRNIPWAERQRQKVEQATRAAKEAPRAQAPDPQAQTPDPQAQTPDPQAQAPEHLDLPGDDPEEKDKSPKEKESSSTSKDNPWAVKLPTLGTAYAMGAGLGDPGGTVGPTAAAVGQLIPGRREGIGDPGTGSNFSRPPINSPKPGKPVPFKRSMESLKEWLNKK